MKFLCLCLVLVLTSVGAIAHNGTNELPAPPDGFTWKELAEIKAAFLQPAGWHFKHEADSGTEAYFITLEDIDRQGSFLTGLSINSIADVSKKTKTWAKQYARLLHEQVKKDTSVVVEKEWENPQGAFAIYGLRYKKQFNNELTIVMHQLVVANEKTDRLYVIMFESTEEFWNAAWRVGDVMMTKFVLDERV